MGELLVEEEVGILYLLTWYCWVYSVDLGIANFGRMLVTEVDSDGD